MACMAMTVHIKHYEGSHDLGQLSVPFSIITSHVVLSDDSSHVLQEEIRGFHGAYTLDYNGCHLMIVSARGILMCMMILHTDLVSNRSSDLKASLNSILWYIISLYIYSKCQPRASKKDRACLSFIAETLRTQSLRSLLI